MTSVGTGPGAAGTSGPAPCERCGENRVDFDERYRPVCRSCGASRVRPVDPARDAMAMLAADPNLILPRPQIKGWAGKSRAFKVSIVITLLLLAVLVGWTAYGMAVASAEGALGAGATVRVAA